MNTFPEIDIAELLEEEIQTTEVHDLVVFNDDFNTFDHVINTLMKIPEL